MKIVFASPEAYPFVSTGGLADVAGSLSTALLRAGHDVTLILPMYRDISISGEWDWLKGRFITGAGEEFGIASTAMPSTNLKVLLVSKDEYFNRKGLYGPSDDSAFPDNAMRYAFFSRAVTAICESMSPTPDILHCHDWQTGLAAAYARNLRKPAVVFTIHNLRYQGNFPLKEYTDTLLPESLLGMEGLEFYGSFSCMKAGIVFSDGITTVSNTYSEEIQSPQFGEGMDGVIRQHSGKLTGIVNGIDQVIWNPSDDAVIASSFSADHISARRSCRTDLADSAVLGEIGNRMIVGMVTRLTSQKGLDLLLPIAGKLVGKGISLVILGTGEKVLARRLMKISRTYKGRISVNLKYDERFARKIFAGCDLFLMPSRFEPCGLGQMIAMRYGGVPLVRKTGGLADTVIDVMDDGTGFVFSEPHPEALLKTLLRARGEFQMRRRWTWLAKKCMRQDNSWSSRTGLYEAVYRRALESRRNR